MKLNKTIGIVGLLLITLQNLFAQQADSAFFLFPIKPGTQGFLSGTMGELRPNHFHGGIDIKTDGKTGLPVYAAADGYISKVRQSTWGYGNQIFITHPNGLVTTYAHLERFAEPLATYVLKEQYKREVFDLELNFDARMFPVNRRQVVGYSGNTGGSGGPHLHFEVRDEKGYLLNPLQYRFRELKDTTPPQIIALGLRPLSSKSRVNGRLDFQAFKAQKKGAGFVLADTIYAFDEIGFSADVFDQLTGAENKNGIVKLSLSVNGKTVYSFSLETILFEKSRQILKHIDFEVQKQTGKYYHTLYLQDGNDLGIHNSALRNGKVKILADSVYNIGLTVEDAYHNTSTLQAIVKGRKPFYFYSASKKTLKPAITHEVHENILKIYAADTVKQATNAELFLKGRQLTLLPAYTHLSRTVYVYDLRNGLPDSVRFCGRSAAFNFQQLVPSVIDYRFVHPQLELFFPAGSLFDTLYLSVKRTDAQYQINDLMVPVAKHFTLTLKNTGIKQKAKSAGYALGNGKNLSFEGGIWENDRLQMQTRNFGKFAILTDSTGPVIKMLPHTPKQVRFKVHDKMSGLASWRAELNGKWLLLKYEHKENLLYSEQLQKSALLKGKLVVKATDKAGNETIFTTKL